MAIIPTQFPTPPSIAAASYDYTDIAEGTGVQVFYGYNTKVFPNSKDYSLSQNEVFSHDIESSSAFMLYANPSVPLVIFNEDFDLTAFNLPKTVKGTAIVKVPYFLYSPGANRECRFYSFVDIIHYDGTTETSLGSASGAYYTAVSTSGAYQDVIPITLQTKQFKKGDILRLNVQFYGSSEQSGMESNCIWLSHSPQNRAGYYMESTALRGSSSGAIADTRLMVYIPFKLNL